MQNERDTTSRILLLGANGQLGVELRDTLKDIGVVTPLTRDDVDLRDSTALIDYLDEHRFDLIVNSAAYTNVDGAESDPDAADALNAKLPEVLGKHAAETGAIVLHYSTDFVFDGQGRRPYREDDPVRPLSQYGRSKLAGEKALTGSGGKCIILRISWLFSSHHRNFLTTILAAAGKRDSLTVVSDQVGCPTSARFVARATAAVISLVRFAEADDACWGVYHASAAGAVSWCEYARHIVAEAARQGITLTVQEDSVVPVSSSEYKTAAVRPAYSVLDSRKLAGTFGIRADDWKVDVDSVIKELAGNRK